MTIHDDKTDAGHNTTQHDVTLAARPEDLPALAPGTRASLIVIEGWEIGRELEVHGHAQELGRSNLVSTFIGAGSVSRRHARIDFAQEEGHPVFTLTDLGSSNGTRVNGERVDTAQLRNGDKVRLGDVLFKFVLQDEIDAQFHQRVHQLIHYDQLTGLLTMDSFRARLETTLRQRSRSKPLVLGMSDLDGLKKVNDNYGHLAGRMIVGEMGAMMRQCLREQDVAGLYGGDEGIQLYLDLALDGALEIAERLRKTIEERVFEHNGHRFGVTISQGLAEWPAHGQTIEGLIAAADQALYAAKSKGRNCIVDARALRA